MKQKNLFTRLGLEKFSEQEKTDLSEQLGGIVLDRIAARLEALLSPEQMTTFEAKLKTDETAAFALLKQYVPDYPKIAREEIEQLKAELLHDHAAIMKKLGY